LPGLLPVSAWLHKFGLVANKVDSLLIFDNSKPESELIAEKEIESFTIHNSQKFNKLKSISDEQ
jgi:hypothetical protein